MDTKNQDKYRGMMLDGRYELVELIGSGGMAVVYKAMCHRLNRYVAVKIMRPELAKNEKFRRRFQTESQAIAKLSHPNIVGVYDVSRTDHVEYIVMELVDGITLKQYLQDHGPLDAVQAVDFSLQIARALAHAHGKGIVHRDIKPQNILVVNDGVIKVADFGIANLQSEVPDVENEAIGSVHYISPEQARGLPVDGRSDIYSLGIVMYEMLSGKLPFDGDDDRTVALKHLSAVPTPLREIAPSVPEALEKIVMKAMEASLDNRYQTGGRACRRSRGAAEIAHRLTRQDRGQRCAAEHGGRAWQGGLCPPPPPRPPRQHALRLFRRDGRHFDHCCLSLELFSERYIRC